MYVGVMGKGDKKKAWLIESYREGSKVKKRLHKCFGYISEINRDDPDAFDKLKAKYSNQEDPEQKRLRESNAVLEVLNNKIKEVKFPAHCPMINYAGQITLPLWRYMGLNKTISDLQHYHNPNLNCSLNDVIYTLCSLKLWDPGSVRHAYRHKADLLGAPLYGVSLDQMYEALSFMSAHKETIFRNINRILDKKMHRTYTMVFYDVTNAYFESCLTDEERNFIRDNCYEDVERLLKTAVKKGEMEADEVAKILNDKEFDFDNIKDSIKHELRCILYLRMRGFSKEHRYDLPVISLALVIDENAIPIDFEIYSGCTSEYKTMSTSISRMKKKYQIKKTIVVADRGLNSTQNLQMLLDEGHVFLVAQKISNLKSSDKKKMLAPEGYEEHIILRDKHAPATEDNIADRIRFKSIDFTKEDKHGNNVKCKLIFTHSTKREARDLNTIELAVKKASAAEAKKEVLPSSRQSWLNFIDKPKGKQTRAEKLNQEAINKTKELAGYSGIVYHEVPGHKSEKIDARMILNAYHHLVQIEDCFRIMKNNLGLRPMYVQLEDRITGHVMCCVLALIMVRLLQIKLDESGYNLSIEEITCALRDARLAVIPAKDGEHIFVSISDYNDIYKNRERLFDEDIRKDLQTPQSNNTDKLLLCQGLMPLPATCGRQHLRMSFKDDFSSTQPLIDPNVYELMTSAHENSFLFEI